MKDIGTLMVNAVKQNLQLQDTVSVIKRIVEHQKWKKFSIMGHGIGAEIAILYAASFPKQVKSRKRLLLYTNYFLI